MLFLILSCGYRDDGLIDLQYCEDPQRPVAQAVDREVTWYADVEPIFATRCAGCHADGEAAPFALTTYDEVAAYDQPVYEAIVRGEMPPWSAEDCCGKTYRTDRRLAQDELDLVVAWLEQDMPVGDEADHVPLESAPGTLERVDVEVALAEPYSPSGKNGTSDEVRCFLVELPEEAWGRYATGFHFQPDNRPIVHHAIVDLVAADDRSTFEELDAASSGPGWDCYGGGGTGTGGNLGGWVPGQGALEMPEGLGRKIEPGTLLLLNLHYDMTAGDGQDQSSVQFMLEDSVDHEVTALALMHPLWLYGESMAVPGDSEETSYGFSWDPSKFYGWKTYDVWGAFFHMHELGQSGSIAILDARVPAPPR